MILRESHQDSYNQKYSSNLTFNTKFNELSGNLNKALDKIFDQDELLEKLEKEKTVVKLEYNQLKNDYEKVMSEK